MQWRFAAVALATSLWGSVGFPAAASGNETEANASKWGVRNILAAKPLSEWSQAEFEAEFAGYPAGYAAFWIFWGEFEPSNDDFVEGKLEVEKGLDRASAMDAIPVIVFHLTKPGGNFWAMNYDAWSMQTCQATGTQHTAPIDLFSPPEGQSAILEDAATELAKCIAEHTTADTVYLRFHNEPWHEWPLGENDGGWNVNLATYRICYEIFRDAIEAVEDDPTLNPNCVEFKVGHGSLPRRRILPRRWWEMGNAPGGESLRVTLIGYMNAYVERDRCHVEDDYPGVSLPIDDWAEATAFAGPSAGNCDLNARLDAWLDRMVSWTCQELFDFTTFHPHGKPEFVNLEQAVFGSMLAQSTNPACTGNPPPWVAAEATFELRDQADWEITCPGADLDAFSAEDLVRKWMRLLASDTIFCSPIVGQPLGPAVPQPPRIYHGLYRDLTEDAVQAVCDPATADPCPDYESCTDVDEGPGELCRLPASKAFVFLSTRIGNAPVVPLQIPVGVQLVRFGPTAQDEYVDVLWHHSLLDTIQAPLTNVTITKPQGYPNATEYDIYGSQQSTSTHSMTFSTLDKVPRVIVWAD